ncbi:hypothetical protein Dimus_009899 [Dionaea muscipula]
MGRGSFSNLHQQMIFSSSLDLAIMGAHIIRGGARSGHLVAMRYLIAGIAIMKPRILWKLILFIGMISHAMRSSRLSAPSAAQNKKFSNIVLSVESVWGNTTVESAISLKMIFQKCITIAMNVESAELGAKRISFTVNRVVAAILSR